MEPKTYFLQPCWLLMAHSDFFLNKFIKSWALLAAFKPELANQSLALIFCPNPENLRFAVSSKEALYTGHRIQKSLI